MLPLLVILVEEFAISGTTQIDLLMIGGALILGALIVATFLLLVPPLQERAQRKAGFVEPFRFSLRDDGVQVEHPRQDNLFRWSGIHAVTATDERFFIYTTSSCALIVPKRCFPSDAAFEEWSAVAILRWSDARAPQ